MADYGVNIAIKFNEAKLNKLTKKLNEASKTTDKINAAFKRIEVKGVRSLDTLTKSLDKKLKKQKRFNKELERENKLLTENASLQRQATRSGRNGGGGLGGGGRLSQAVLGGGFPLLFGGGPLQALGGGIGGALGGFAGGIAGQIITGQVEAFATAAAQTGQALNSVSTSLDFVRDKSLFASAADRERAAILEEQGRVSELANLVTQQFVDKIGYQGVAALQELGKTTDKTTQLWNTLTLQLQRLVAGPLNTFLEAINRVLGQTTAGFTRRGLLEDLSAADRARAEARFAELTGRDRSFTGRGGQKRREELRKRGEILSDVEATKILQQEFGKARQVLAGITPTAADFRTFRAPKVRKTDAEREAERRERRALAFEEQQRKLIENKIVAFERESQQLQNQEVLIRAKIAGNEEEVRYAIELGQLQEKYGEEEGRRRADQKARIRASTEALREQEIVQQRINTLVNTAGQQFTGLFETLINGTNDWNSALRNVLTSLSSALLRFGLGSLGGNDGVGLFSILSGSFTGGRRALGGSVSSNRPYMVGERGPELFVPGAQGNIVPNNAMGGANVVVNVDASGSNVEGNADQANQLGKAIGLAVQQELIKQKRPGGLLAGV